MPPECRVALLQAETVVAWGESIIRLGRSEQGPS